VVEYDRLLFELITARANTAPDGEGRMLVGAVGPTEEARALAQAHGLCAQLDALDLSRPGWHVADMTTEEIAEVRARQGMSGGTRAADNGGVISSTSVGWEAFLVLLRGRVPGAGPLRLTLRAVCFLLPCPEAHLLLFDWVLGGGGGRPAPTLGALLDLISSGDFFGARRLAFAQMVVSSQRSAVKSSSVKGRRSGWRSLGAVTSATTSMAGEVLLNERNDIALAACETAFAVNRGLFSLFPPGF